jgi:hypothetical protein
VLTQSCWVTTGKAHKTLRGLGNKGIAGLPPEVIGPRGRHLTGLVEPCGAIPRKCFIFFICAGSRIDTTAKDYLTAPMKISPLAGIRDLWPMVQARVS